MLNRFDEDDVTKLLSLRRGLTKALQWDKGTKAAPGEDLGFQKRPPPLMPAHQRFRGLLYREIPSEMWARVKRAPDVEVLIVSSLYGVVDYREPIRDYDVHMDATVADQGMVRDWWSRGGIPEILSRYMASAGFSNINNYLSGNYDGAVGGLEAIVPEEIEYRRPKVKAPPMQANRYRGIELVKTWDALLP